MGRKKLRQSNKLDWNNLPWKQVDLSRENLGEFDDAVFFGLEEIDGSEYQTTSPSSTLNNNSSSSLNKVKKLKKKQKIEEKEIEEKEIDENWEDDLNNDKDNDNNNNDDNNNNSDNNDNIKKNKKQKNLLKLNKQNKDNKDKNKDNKEIKINYENIVIDNSNKLWDNSVSLHNLLVKSLNQLNFLSPTPIQSISIPIILSETCDLVGSAETGSGKTLAFGLPILHSLLNDWEMLRNQSLQYPYSLILAPTRELAVQISTVLTDICKCFPERKIQIINIIGGMSEQKQRRLLCNPLKPVHIIVATPGRFCDLIDEPDMKSLQNLGFLKYLVIDEADRMMEDGHFPELFKIFNRIREHEKFCSQGKDPIKVSELNKMGRDYEEAEKAINRAIEENKRNNNRNFNEDFDEEDGEDIEDMEEAINFQFDEIPSDDLIENAKLVQPDKPIDEQNENNGELEEDKEDKDDEELEEDNQDEEDNLNQEQDQDQDEDQENDENENNQSQSQSQYNDTLLIPYTPNQRQTLLFSATALRKEEEKDTKRQRQLLKKEYALVGQKKVHYYKSLGLPENVRQLLEVVGIQENTRIANSKPLESLNENPKKRKHEDSQTNNSCTSANDNSSKVDNSLLTTLPVGLKQFEIRVPVEDKDIITYYYLLKNPGRTLIFVNSIKTARRLDGLLRALEINSRTIHAQLQQKQRLKALESFRSTPIGVLVATDVAARGLDLPRIQYVLHYDVARSPQVYIHRSGRTARAGTQGISLSIVSAEDRSHHEAICQFLNVPALSLLRVDLSSTPILLERVKLAKKIFLQSFISNQTSKELSWLEQTAKSADLIVDEDLYADIELELKGKGKSVNKKKKNQDSSTSQSDSSTPSKKSVELDRLKLKQLLNQPWQTELTQQSNPNIRRKRQLIVVAK